MCPMKCKYRAISPSSLCEGPHSRLTSTFSLVMVIMLLPHLRSTRFPYTTLFRSVDGMRHAHRRAEVAFEHHAGYRSEEHTSELQSLTNLVCRLLLEKKKRIGVQMTRDLEGVGSITRITTHSFHHA